jgi:hypothetical protein
MVMPLAGLANASRCCDRRGVLRHIYSSGLHLVSAKNVAGGINVLSIGELLMASCAPHHQFAFDWNKMLIPIHRVTSTWIFGVSTIGAAAGSKMSWHRRGHSKNHEIHEPHESAFVYFVVRNGCPPND